jgi:hypothetical protein
MELTTEQAQILSADGSFRIMAGAGSGKTTTLTWYVRDTIRKGRATAEEIAFITFTRLASHDISKKVRQLIPTAHICVGTFHKVMLVNFMSAAGIALPNPVNLYDGCMERNVEFVLQQMRVGEPRLVAHLRTYRLLVVDEFQDLDPAQFEFIMLFRRIQPALQIIAIGDLAQNIYRFRGTSNEFLRRLLHSEIVPDLATFYLRTNFRSSKAILDTVNAVFATEIRDGHVQPMVYGGSASGMRPQFFEACDSMDYGEYEIAVIETIVPIILEAKKAGKSVVLIFPIIKCQSYELILALLSSRMRGDAIDFHRIAKEDATSAIVEITYDARDTHAPVQLSTFHASKGLEWDIVFLVNVSDDVYRLRENEVDDEGFYTERTNLLYVGMTRPREALYIFGKGLRHRLLARIPDLDAVMDITVWGEDNRTMTTSLPGPASVAKLVKSATLHPDVFERMVACSEHIGSSFHRGQPLLGDKVYDEMKRRNREMEFGTFMDWMIKLQVTDTPTLQCRLLEILSFISYSNGRWFHRDHAKASHDVLSAVIADFFERAGTLPNTDPMAYIMPARHIAAFSAKRFRMPIELTALYDAAARRIIGIFKKTEHTLRDKYILSHTLSMYKDGQLNAVRAVDAPVNSYMGLPSGFDEFAAASVAPAAAIVRAAAAASGFQADIPVESASLLYGEMDLITEDGDCVVEIKCSAETTAAGLRGSSSCVNLLQLLAYVAIARHGTPPRRNPKNAVLVNPLTATWERYDLTTWSMEQSAEFLACLEELQRRG